MANAPNEVDAAFKVVLKRTGAILREQGFKGSGQNYRRACTGPDGEIWQAVNFQKTQWRSPGDESINFTINLLVHFPELVVESHSERPKELSKLRVEHADARWRAGEFIDGGDAWWDVTAAGVEVFWSEFEPVVRGTIVPVMNRVRTREGLIWAARKRPSMISRSFNLWLGDDAPPPWHGDERDAGKWRKDADGLWWGPGEWA